MSTLIDKVLLWRSQTLSAQLIRMVLLLTLTQELLYEYFSLPDAGVARHCYFNY